jgi:hypothetical protein
MVHLEHYAVTYPRAFVARRGALNFTASPSGVFQVDGLTSDDAVVYRRDDQGLSYLARIEVMDGDASGTFSVRFPGSAEPAGYHVASGEAILTPELALAPPPDPGLTEGDAQYLVISHPDFIDDLTPLLERRQAQGFAVKVVDVEALYAQFGHGIFGPEPIRDYIRFAAQNLGTQYVLLVGGDSYDYRNYLGLGSLSFLPSLYGSTGEVARVVPLDPMYTDLDDDQVPDLPIGRFPVRTSQELAWLVEKTLDYGIKGYGRTALFTADESFSSNAESIAGPLEGAGWTVATAYLDDMPVDDARQRITQEINKGTALINFVGHSGPATWTFRGLYSAEDAEDLANRGFPTVVNQWGCWNTYYVEPSANTLAHKFLVKGQKGAAAVLGATTISQDYSQELLGSLLTSWLSRPGTTIGTAIQEAKRALAESNPEMLDVLLGWTLLGDPALVIQSY